MFDANAKVGALRSCTVGRHAPDEESCGGHELHKFLLRFDLALPATMEGPSWQRPEGDWTWTNHRGGKHRIDYVAVPAAWLAMVHWAAVLHEVDLTLELAMNHRPVAVRLASPTASYGKAPAQWSNKGAFRSAETREMARAFWAGAPRFPEGMRCAEMADLFEKWCRIIM